MNETPKIGRVPYVGVWTAVAGAAAGSLEAALIARFDPEVTVGVAGGFILWAANAVLVAAGAVLFGGIVELASRLAARVRAKGAGSFSARSILGRIIGLGTRVIPAVRKRNRRAKTATTAVAFAVLLYGAYLGNLYLLPGKLHPISILADAVILLAAYGILRLGSLLAPRAAFVWGGCALVFVAGAGIILMSGTRSETADGESPGTRDALLGPKEQYNNVILITLDTTRADRLGCYGRDPTITPNLDRLARRGILYERAYCAMPLTGPSHAALLSGLTAREAGVIQNGRPVPAEVTTLPEVFKAAGYRTGAVVGAFPVSSKLGFDRGFEHFDDHFSPLNALTRVTVSRLAGDLGLLRTKARLQRRADEVTDRAVAWLERRDARPFFLWVHYFDPHTPYDPPPAYLTDEPEIPEIRAYDGEVKYMDASVGRLLSYVDESGLAASTVIIATADHGESLGEHKYYWDHGRYVYEPSMRVPYIIAGPGAQPGVLERRPVSNTAVFEAALALAGGGTVPAVAERPLFGEALEEGEYRTMWLSGENPRKYISNHGAGADEFYDLIEDPRELENVVNAEPEAALYAESLKSFEDSLPTFPELSPLDKDTASKMRDLGYINR